MIARSRHICARLPRSRFRWALLFLPLLAALPRSALGEVGNPDDTFARPFTVGIAAGVRSFGSDLDLESEIAFGMRVGLGASERVTVLLDAVHSSPARKVTGSTAEVTTLRGLTQVRLRLGRVRPYLVAGVGGLLFNFDDASDTAVGAVTAGGGVELRIGKRALLHAEISADIYRARRTSYSSTGSVLSSNDRDTEAAQAALAGVSLEF